MNLHWGWWCFAGYLLAGIIMVINDYFEAKKTGALKLYNIRWWDMALSIPIALPVYLWMKPWKTKGDNTEH